MLVLSCWVSVDGRCNNYHRKTFDVGNQSIFSNVTVNFREGITENVGLDHKESFEYVVSRLACDRGSNSAHLDLISNRIFLKNYPCSTSSKGKRNVVKLLLLLKLRFAIRKLSSKIMCKYREEIDPVIDENRIESVCSFISEMYHKFMLWVVVRILTQVEFLNFC